GIGCDVQHDPGATEALGHGHIKRRPAESRNEFRQAARPTQCTLQLAADLELVKNVVARCERGIEAEPAYMWGCRNLAPAGVPPRWKANDRALLLAGVRHRLGRPEDLHRGRTRR